MSDWVTGWVYEHDPMPLVPIRIRRLGDVSIDDPYVEACWLPVVGPSSLWIYRRLVGWALVNDRMDVSLGSLAARVGIGGNGRHSIVVRSVARLVRFGLAEIREDEDVMAVQTSVPRLSERHERRLMSLLVGATSIGEDGVVPASSEATA